MVGGYSERSCARYVGGDDSRSGRLGEIAGIKELAAGMRLCKVHEARVGSIDPGDEGEGGRG